MCEDQSKVLQTENPRPPCLVFWYTRCFFLTVWEDALRRVKAKKVPEKRYCHISFFIYVHFLCFCKLPACGIASCICGIAGGTSWRPWWDSPSPLDQRLWLKEPQNYPRLKSLGFQHGLNFWTARISHNVFKAWLGAGCDEYSNIFRNKYSFVSYSYNF